MTCQNAMSGKSATGNDGKVGYYEHSWATKRDSGLSKKLFQCNPHRMPAKKLEPLVWQEFQKFVLDKSFAKQVFAKVQGLNAANSKNKDTDRIKAKLHGLHSQIEALAERLAELPKSVSAGPIYRQLERLENLKKENEQELVHAKAEGRSSKDRTASLENFEAFAARYRKIVLGEMDADQRKQVLQKFIRKVEVGTETVKIHFIVDKDSIEEELIPFGARKRT